MKIKDTAIIISKKILKENSAIINFFTKHHGIYAGVVSNINSKKSHIYQIGNIVDFFWNARLEEHIGSAKCELLFSCHNLMNNKTKLYALNSLFSVITYSFQERVICKDFYIYLEKYLQSNELNFSIMDYFLLEEKILEEAGYGLDLSKCVVTDSTTNLAYVSPKSGRAVSLEAGMPYKNLLLKLPECIITGKDPQSLNELDDLLNLLSYFFRRYIFKNKEPDARKLFIEMLRSSFI